VQDSSILDHTRGK
jgi:hypothetical protein